MERAVAAGVARDGSIVDPGFGFGKTRRPQPRARCAGSTRSGSLGPAGPAGGVAQVDARQGPRPAGGASGSRRRWRRRPSGSRRASTSSASTTCRRTSAPPGWPTRSSRLAAVRRHGRGRSELSDRIVLHNMQLPGPPRLLRRTSWSRPSRSRSTSSWSSTCSPPASTTTSRRPSTTPGSTTRPARSSSRRRFRLLEALAEAIATRSSPTSAVDEVGVRVRKPKVELGGPLDYAGVEIWRRRPTG